jgi:hypothetical protein
MAQGAGEGSGKYNVTVLLVLFDLLQQCNDLYYTVRDMAWMGKRERIITTLMLAVIKNNI